ERHLLLLGFHHLVVDGASYGQIVQEVTAFFAGSPLPPPRLQFQDFAAWQRARIDRGELELSRRYWMDRLGGHPPPPQLPTTPPPRGHAELRRGFGPAPPRGRSARPPGSARPGELNHPLPHLVRRVQGLPSPADRLDRRHHRLAVRWPYASRPGTPGRLLRH